MSRGAGLTPAIMDHPEARPATAADLPEVHALIESAYRGDTAKAGWTHEADLLEGPRTSLEALEAILGNPDELLLLFRDGSAIIGCVHLTRLSATSAYFGLLTVQPGRQSGGLGKHIIATAEREAMRRFGARTMELSVVSQRPELIAYYTRRGYIETGDMKPFPIPLDPPFFLAVMRKPLENNI
ncbi:MAG: GNAT family N-acetyltransferase [Sphingobium phenoxybenzoativorans]